MFKFFIGLLLGIAAGVSANADAAVVAAAQMKDGIVLLTDQDFQMCPEGMKLAVAKTPDGQMMPGCWGLDEKKENVVIVWISPPFKFPTGAFEKAPTPATAI